MSHSSSNYIWRTFVRGVIYFFTFRILSALFTRSRSTQRAVSIQVLRGRSVLDEVRVPLQTGQRPILYTLFFWIGILVAVWALGSSAYVLYCAFRSQ